MLSNSVAVLDKFFTVKSANVEFFALVGSKIQRSLLMLVHPDDVSKLEEAVNALTDDNTGSVVVRIKNVRNEYVIMHVNLKLRKGDTEDERFIDATFVDIMDLEKMFNKANDDYKILRNHICHMEMIIFEYDYESKIIVIYFISNSQKIILEREDIDVWMNNAINKHFIDEKQVLDFKNLCYDIKSAKINFYYELTSAVFTKGEKIETNIIRGGIVKAITDRPLVAGTIATVTEAKVASVENSFSRSFKDPMTGVLNKESIIKYAKNRIETLQKGESVVIAILDLDNFKMVNDTFGHLYGDKVIISFANLISQMVGERGVVGRFGGDEFFIVLNDIKDELDLRCILRAIRTNVEIEFKDVGDNISLTCSIGAATYPKDAANYTELFNKADYCLYLSKMRGKNRYVMFDYMVKEHNYINDKLDLKKDKVTTDHINYVRNLIDDVIFKGEDYIIDILSQVADRFKLSRIRVFYGDNLELKYKWGVDSEQAQGDFSVAKEENLINDFEDNNVFIINYLSNIEVKFPKTYRCLSNAGVLSSVLYLLGTKDDVKGIISFETMDMTTHWMEDSIFNFALAGHLIDRCIFKDKSRAVSFPESEKK